MPNHVCILRTQNYVESRAKTFHYKRIFFLATSIHTVAKSVDILTILMCTSELITICAEPACFVYVFTHQTVNLDFCFVFKTLHTALVI